MGVVSRSQQWISRDQGMDEHDSVSSPKQYPDSWLGTRVIVIVIEGTTSKEDTSLCCIVDHCSGTLRRRVGYLGYGI